MYVGTADDIDGLSPVIDPPAARIDSNNRWSLPFSASMVDLDLLDKIIVDQAKTLVKLNTSVSC